MKKLIALLMIIALLLPAAVLADLPDISHLTDEELIELNRQIQLKLFSNKMIEGVNVPSGVYTVGIDIPVGAYRIVYKPPYETAFCQFTLQESGGGYYYTQLGFSGSNEIGKIYLNENAVVTINDADLIFYAYSGLFN